MNRILVGVDGSPRAPLVLSAARRLADMSGAKLVVYHAVSQAPDVSSPEIAYENRLDEKLLADARAALDTLAADIPPAMIEAKVVEFATAWDGIYRAAQRLVADLIVIGSHGYGKLDRLIGTTAAKVVNHADRNVLVVRTAL